MSFRESALPVTRGKPSKEDFRKTAKKVVRSGISEEEKIGVTAASELFGGAIGSIPGLATQTSQMQPYVEELESESRPEFLSSTGLEAAPEKGLTNLLSMIGKIPGIENYTPEALREKFRESTENKFVPESNLGKAIAHGSSLAGQAIPFGTGLPNLLRVALGGIAGETLRQKGAPEPLAFGAEVLTPGVMSAFGKKLPLNLHEEELAALSKKIGLSDKQVAAILKSPKSQATFAKFAAKGEKAENLVSSMFENLGDNYSNLKTEGRAKGYIKGDILDNLLEKWNETLFDLEQTHKPSADKASAIDFIKSTIEDVDTKGSNIEKLINLYQDINRTVNWNAWSGGKKQLAALKEPIKKAIIRSDPLIGKDFVNTNELYRKSIQLAKLLKPTQLEQLLAHGHAGEIALGIATLNPGLLNKYLGFLGSRQIFREILFSPRFNKMHQKMLLAIKGNKSASINQVLKEFHQEIKKTFPEESEDFSIPEYQ